LVFKILTAPSLYFGSLCTLAYGCDYPYIVSPSHSLISGEVAFIEENFSGLYF